MGKYQEAEEEIQRSIKTLQRALNAHEAEEGIPRIIKVIRFLHNPKAAERHPYIIESRQALTELWMQQGRFEEAVKNMRELAELLGRPPPWPPREDAAQPTDGPPIKPDNF